MIRNLALAATLLLIAGCGNIASTAAPEQPAEAAEVAEVVEAPVEDFLTLGKAQGYEAAVAAQTAADNEWGEVSEKWDLAVRTLGQVPADSPNYATAQAKIAEYNANRDVAADRHFAYQAKTNKPTSGVTPVRAEAIPAAPLNSYRGDPSANALAAYEAKIREADPDGMVVTKIEGLGSKGAAGVIVTEGWQLLPAISRENSAQDLHNIWVGEVVKTGGNRNSAQILIFDRHGDTIARVSAGGVKLNE